jgi:chromosome segregation ATPase
MAVPWIAVGQLVLNNLDTILGVVKPAFTRKRVETLPSQTELLNQQIAELQAAASNNADQIRQLAAQLKEVVAALEQAASSAQAERRRLTRLSIIATTISLAAAAAAVLALSQ